VCEHGENPEGVTLGGYRVFCLRITRTTSSLECTATLNNYKLAAGGYFTIGGGYYLYFKKLGYEYDHKMLA